MWKTLDIVPSSIRDDPQVIAACGAIDQELSQIYDCIPSILFWPFVDEQVPPLLDMLAWEMHVDIWQGWEGDLDNETKIQLINQSIDFHRHKGTRYAVDQILKTVFKQGTVTEWYEYGGLPFFFRIVFEDDISGTQWNQVLEAVYAMKNVRSWLDGFLKTRQHRQQLYHGIAVTQQVTTKIKWVNTMPLPVPPVYDLAASDFFTRAGITNTTQKNAIDALVKALKSANIWSKMRALYPFVGGTATSHSHNLRNSSYQITWGQGFTHSATGITSDSSDTSYCNLNLNTTTLGSIAFGAYNKTATASAGTFPAEVYAIANPIFYQLLPRYSDNQFYGMASSGSTFISVANITDARGFYIVTRQSMTLYKAFKDGIQFGTSQTDTPAALPNTLFAISGTNNLALVFISDGLSDAECVLLSTAVKTFETSLGRNN